MWRRIAKLWGAVVFTQTAVIFTEGNVEYPV